MQLMKLTKLKSKSRLITLLWLCFTSLIIHAFVVSNRDSTFQLHTSPAPIYLFPGPSKTASTSLQMFFKQNSQMGWHWLGDAEADCKSHAKLLQSLTNNTMKEPEVHRSYYGSEEILQYFKKDLLLHTYESVIIAAEDIDQIAMNDDLSEMIIDGLIDFVGGREIKVVLVKRFPRVEHLISWYKEEDSLQKKSLSDQICEGNANLFRPIKLMNMVEKLAVHFEITLIDLESIEKDIREVVTCDVMNLCKNGTIANVSHYHFNKQRDFHIPEESWTNEEKRNVEELLSMIDCVQDSNILDHITIIPGNVKKNMISELEFCDERKLLKYQQRFRESYCMTNPRTTYAS